MIKFESSNMPGEYRVLVDGMLVGRVRRREESVTYRPHRGRGSGGRGITSSLVSWSAFDLNGTKIIDRCGTRARAAEALRETGA